MKTLQTKQTTPRRFSPATVALAAMLAASVALGSCSKSEPEPTPVAADGTIRAVASIQKSIELGTKAPNDITSVDGLKVYAYVWNSTSQDDDFTTSMVAKGTMTFKAGLEKENAVSFDSGFTGTNLLPVDKSRVLLKAQYPADGWGVDKSTIMYTFSGCEDVMASKVYKIARAGGVDNNLPEFASIEMLHCLTRFEISVKAENAGTQAAWGKIKSVEFKKATGDAFFDTWICYNDESGAGNNYQAYDVCQWPTYRITKPTDKIVYTDTQFDADDFASSLALTTTATPVCYTMMASFRPTAGTTAVVLEVTTLDKQGGTEVKTEVPLDIDPATLPSGSDGGTMGVAFAVNLTFRGNEIIPTATITPWQSTGSGASEATPSKPYPYVEDGKFIVSRNFKGQDPAAKFHPVWTTTPAHGDTDTDIADAVSEKFEVAQSDAVVDGNTLMDNWFIASGTVDATYNPAPGKKACADGWRHPTRAELSLIYKQRTALTVDGFATGAFGGDYYWSSTKPYYVYFENGRMEVDGPDGSGYVRCVRDIAKPGDYYYTDGSFSPKVESGKTVNGLVYWVDAANPTKFKVMALDESSTESAQALKTPMWAAKNTYVIGSGAQSPTDGRGNAAAIKLYSAGHTGDANAETQTTGTFAIDFPAAAYCYNYTGKGGADPVGTWYLPAKNELQYLYCAYNGAAQGSWVSGAPAKDLTTQAKWNGLLTASGVGGTGVTSGTFWSSTEFSFNASSAWYVAFSYGSTGYDDKGNYSCVRCVREL